MRATNQEISFEVAEKNETVTVDIYSPKCVEVPPPGMAYSDWKAQQLRETEQLQPHEKAFLEKAKSQKERDEIWIAIKADQRLRQKKEQEKQLQQTTQTNRREPTTTKARGKKKRRAPLTILQTIRFKAGAKYNLLAAERIVSHICRRQGSKKNQERHGCFESIPNMAKACRIRINRFRKLLAWLTKAGILIARHRENQSAKYTVAPGRQMIMPMIIDDLKLTPAQNAVARIMLRYGIISIRQAAKLAHTSARTAARNVLDISQKKTPLHLRLVCVDDWRFSGFCSPISFAFWELGTSTLLRAC